MERQQRDYPKYNAEKQIFGKCESDVKRWQIKQVKQGFKLEFQKERSYQKEFQKQNDIKAILQKKIMGWGSPQIFLRHHTSYPGCVTNLKQDKRHKA